MQRWVESIEGFKRRKATERDGCSGQLLVEGASLLPEMNSRRLIIRNGTGATTVGLGNMNQGG